MALKDDLRGAFESWHLLPWYWKVINIISLFFAVSSAMSVADEIVRWKGYLKDALGFYKDIAYFPFSLIEINVSDFAKDLFYLLIILFVAPGIQAVKMLENELPRGYIYSTDTDKKVIFYCSVFIGLLVGKYKGHYTEVETFLIILAFLVVSWFVLKVVKLPGDKEKLIFTKPVLLAFYGTLFLAQINKGIMS